MKKDEIVVLSNDIEIINGVKVDWSKYKGRNTNHSRNGYVGLCKLLHKNGHTLESYYINNATKVGINFNCGHPIHNTTPNNYKNGKGCPNCWSHSRNCSHNYPCGRSSKYAKQKLYELAEERGHKILGEYINATTKIEIDFNCGHKPHLITPHAYKNGNGCPRCGGTSFEYSKEMLYKIAEERGHKILGEYKGVETKILIDFNCGHQPHNITPRCYKQGQGCPKCKSSKGEKEVARVLKEMDIKYIEQYKFKDCKKERVLPFDFYVIKYNMTIEYDGEQHYKPVSYWNKEDSEHKKALTQKIAEERLKETQRRDKIKTDYCRKNGIKLIRIPYWEFDNIEKILNKELSKYIQAVV